jgi:hypothetical protein
MSQQVKVDRDLIFQGAAEYSQNIVGNPFTTRVCFDENFFFPCDEHDWVEEETNGGTIAWAAPHSETLTTGGANDDVAEFSHASTWTGSRNAMMQARINLTSIADVGVNVGFVDADMSTDDQICFEISAGAATLVNARGNEGACFVYDTDGNPDYWYMCAVDSGTEGTPVSLGVAPVAATYAWFGVKVDTSGNVTYYYNFKPVGFQAAAVTASTALLPYVSVIARTTAAKVVTVDRIICWQDEE